jgi:hypothetical protein
MDKIKGFVIDRENIILGEILETELEEEQNNEELIIKKIELNARGLEKYNAGRFSPDNVRIILFQEKGKVKRWNHPQLLKGERIISLDWILNSDGGEWIEEIKKK